MKPLSRAFARLVLLFFALGIFFLAVNELIPYRTLGDRYRVMDTAYWIKNTLRITGIVLLVNGGIQWVRNLRCPYCGRGYAMPWWRKGEKHFCDRCGRSGAVPIAAANWRRADPGRRLQRVPLAPGGQQAARHSADQDRRPEGGRTRLGKGQQRENRDGHRSR